MVADWPAQIVVWSAATVAVKASPVVTVVLAELLHPLAWSVTVTLKVVEENILLAKGLAMDASSRFPAGVQAYESVPPMGANTQASGEETLQLVPLRSEGARAVVP